MLALKTFVPLLFSFLFMVFIVWYGELDRRHLETGHYKQLDTIEDLIQQMALEHLWLEEYLDSGLQENRVLFRKHRALVQKNLSALMALSHESSEAGLEIHQSLGGLLQKLDRNVAIWQSMADTRLAQGPRQPIPGRPSASDDDAAFGSRFEALVDLDEQIEAGIRKQLQAHLAEIGVLNRLLFGVAGLLLVFSIAYVVSSYRKQIAALRRETTLLDSLGESEEKYSILFDAFSDSVFVYDMNGDLLDANAKALKVFGYDSPEIPSLNIRDLHPDEALDASKRAFGKLVENGSIYFETSMKRKNGTVFSGGISASVTELGGRKVALGIVRDITRRKQAEDDLLQRTGQLHALVVASQRVNASLNSAEVRHSLVESAMTLLRVSSGMAGTLVNGEMHFLEYNHEGDWQDINYRFPPGYGVPGWVMEYKKPYLSADSEHDSQVIQEIRQKLGFQMLIDVPICSRSGELLGCFELHDKADGTPFDELDVELLEGLAASAAIALENAAILEDQIKSEQALRESEEKFRNFADKSLVGIYLIQDGVFRYVNPKLAEIFGYTLDELIDRLGPEQLVYEEDWPLVAENIRKRIDGEVGSIHHEFRGLGKDRNVFNVEVLGAATVYNGRPAIIGTLMDITGRKRRENFELEQRRILEMIIDPSVSLSKVLHELVQIIEQQSSSMIASVLLLDDKGEHVLHGAAPHLPDEYNAAIDGAAIGPAVGSCGTAAYTGKTVIVSDIETDPLWADYKDLALSHGLRACWSQPIKDAEDKVLGTFAMYYRECRKPGKTELRLIENASHLAGNAIIHKRMLDEIIQSESALREAQRIALVGNWELDLVHDDLKWSDEIFRIFEIDAKQFGATYEAFLDAIHPDDRDMVKDAYTRSLETKEAYEIRHRLLFRDGRVKYVNERCESFFDEQGQPVRSLGTVQDITEMALAEEQGRRLRQVLEATTDFVGMFDHDGHTIYVNRAGREMMGFGEEEDISSLTIADFHPEAEAEKVLREVLPFADGEGVWTGETLFQSRDGREILTSQLLQTHKSASGAIEYYSIIARDISEKRQQEKKMEHVQRLESLGVLAGGIAHDFNNLLTAIMGHVSLARRKAGPLDATQGSLLAIEETSRKAAELCKQMLAYSGKGKFVVQPVNLSDLVEEMTRLLHVSISKSVLLRDELAANLPAIEVDVAQMQQVIMNLVINANESIGERSGLIVIATGMMEADAEYLKSMYIEEAAPVPGRYVYLEVTDTGCGMDEQTKAHLFEPFFTTKFTGRGLGMSAILGIVRGHGGVIKVYTEPDKGSSFKVLFPAVQDEAVALKSEPMGQPSAATGAGTVLVVDDEETIRSVAAMMLEDAGYSTIQAVDGLDGLKKLKEHRDEIDCVLLDMTMPRMGGEEAFTEMRRIRSDIKVLLSSGYNQQSATQRFTGKGLAGFVQKPYTQDVLLAALAEILKPPQ